jgi:hypothetical protein
MDYNNKYFEALIDAVSKWVEMISEDDNLSIIEQNLINAFIQFNKNEAYIPPPPKLPLIDEIDNNWFSNISQEEIPTSRYSKYDTPFFPTKKPIL